MNCNKISPSEIAWNSRYDNSNKIDQCCNIPGSNKQYNPLMDNKSITTETLSETEMDSPSKNKEFFENISSSNLQQILKNKDDLEKVTNIIKKDKAAKSNNIIEQDDNTDVSALQLELDNYKLKLDNVLGNITDIQQQLVLNKDKREKLKKIDLYEKNNSLSKTSGGLLFFYLMIAGNYVGELFSHQMINALSLRWMKHLVAFSLLLFTISDISGVTKPIYGIILACAVYIWFIFTTKLDFHYNLIIVALLIIGLYVSQYREGAISKYKRELDDNDFKQVETFQNIQYILIGLLILVTTIGNIEYIPRHYSKYKKYYKNPVQFLINFLYL